MKNLILILSICFISLNCKSQNIVPIYNTPSISDIPKPPYYKDVDNDFNKFIGVWKWQNGTDSWTIEFKKVVKFETKIKNEVTGQYSYEYHDVLVGEYNYVVNGISKVNTLPFSIISNKDPFDYGFFSLNISTFNRGFPSCNECAPNTRFIIGRIVDVTRPGLKGVVKMAHFTQNGIEKVRLNVYLYMMDPAIIGPGYTGPKELTIPEGVYTLVKQ